MNYAKKINHIEVEVQTRSRYTLDNVSVKMNKAIQHFETHSIISHEKTNAALQIKFFTASSYQKSNATLI